MENCNHCGRGQKPYLTAYEIALRHGFVGTEKQWVDTIGTIYVAKCVTQATGDWTCDTTFEKLTKLYEQGREIHLLTKDNRTAILDSIGESAIVLNTQPYEVAGRTYYDTFTLADDDTGTYATKGMKPLNQTISKDMCDLTVQASLGKADSALQEHQSLTGLVPRNKQATKANWETQRISITSDGTLYFAPARRILIEQSGGNFEIVAIDFPTNTTVEQIMALAYEGVPIQMINNTTGDSFRLCHAEGTGENAFMVFSGETYYSGTLYLDMYLVSWDYSVYRVLHKELS